MRPTRFTQLAVAVGLAGCLVFLAGCSDDGGRAETLPDGPSSSADSSASSPATSTSPGTEPTTEKGKATAEAEQTVRDYYGFLDRVIADNGIGLDRLDRFLQDPELTERRAYLEQFRKQGFYSEGGSTTFESIKPTKVQLDPKNRKAAVSLRACLNVGNVKVRRKSGDPVDPISPALSTYEVYNYDYPNSTGWKIAIETQPGKRCQQ